MRGMSVCILTYNVFFYNRLAIDHIRKFTQAMDYEILIYDNGSTDGSVEWIEAQPDVTLYKGQNNGMRHGEALDFLTRRAKFPICALLCSDAFPVSPEWVTPALYLDEEIYLAGIRRPGKKRMNVEYTCPSYMFGWTEWLKRHSFVDNWPKWDTGEKLAQECLDEGHKIKTWEYNHVDFDDKFMHKPCDYNGWAWHTWWSGRKQSTKGIEGVEFEEGYHDYSINMLRERFNLDY